MTLDMMQSINGIVVDTFLYVWIIPWQKNSNLMILDNSGIDYAQMLLFVFGFPLYWKIGPNSCAFSSLSQNMRHVLLVSWVWQTKKNIWNRLYYWSYLVQTHDQLIARLPPNASRPRFKRIWALFIGSVLCADW